MKRIVFIVFSLIVLFSASAQANKVHRVAKGETLYSIARRYGVKVNDMVRANPELKNDLHVKIGQELSIPLALPTATAIKVKPVASTPDTPYSEEDKKTRVKVIAGNEALATVSNDAPVIEKPKTETPATPAPTTVVASVSLRTSSSNPAEYPAIFGQYFAHGYKSKKNRGAATYLADNTSGNQYLAFYNDAEVGSVIKVTNMMNKRTVYVKVVGKVPYADASQEVMLKISNKAAHELGALDEKFLVEVLGCTN